MPLLSLTRDEVSEGRFIVKVKNPFQLGGSVIAKRTVNGVNASLPLRPEEARGEQLVNPFIEVY